MMENKNGAALKIVESLVRKLGYHSRKLIFSLLLVIACSSGCGSGGGSDSSSGGGIPGPQLTLGSVVQYSTGNVLISKIAVGDLNGDGLNDVAAIGDLAGIPHILLYYQGTDGKFILIVTIPSPDYLLRGIAIGDASNDGRDDLIVSATAKSVPSGFPGRVFVYVQEPSRTMAQPQQQLTISSADVGDLCVCDLDSDGLKDISVLRAPASDAKGSVAIFYQNRDGLMNQEVVYNESFVRLSGNIRSADMNSDGRIDLVLQSGNDAFTVILQLPDGTLSLTPDVYSIASNTSPFFDSFNVGDVNGDQKNDVVVVSKGTPGSFYLLCARHGRMLGGESPLRRLIAPTVSQRQGCPS